VTDPSEAIAVVRIGAAVWRAIAPWKRLKQARNRRRARRGLQPLPITHEDEKMLPKGTMTYTGLAVTAIGFGLRLAGVGECAPIDAVIDQAAAAAHACVDPGVIDRLVQGANEVLEAGGMLLATLGRLRAAKREALAVGAAKREALAVGAATAATSGR